MEQEMKNAKKVAQWKTNGIQSLSVLCGPFWETKNWTWSPRTLKSLSTAWCSEIGSLTSLDACNSGASSDVRGPISLHQAVSITSVQLFTGRCKFAVVKAKVAMRHSALLVALFCWFKRLQISFIKNYPRSFVCGNCTPKSKSLIL